MLSVVGDSLSLSISCLGDWGGLWKARKASKTNFHSAQSHKQLWCHVESIPARNPSPALFSQLLLLLRSSLLYKLSEKQTESEVYTKIKGNGMIGQWQKTTKARKYTDKCQIHPLDPSICFTTANLKFFSFLTFRMPPAVLRFEDIWYYLLFVPGVDFTSSNGCILRMWENPLHKTVVGRAGYVCGREAGMLTCCKNLWSCF